MYVYYKCIAIFYTFVEGVGEPRLAPKLGPGSRGGSRSRGRSQGGSGEQEPGGIPTRGNPPEKILMGRVLERSQKEPGSRMMAVFLVVLRFDGGMGARARPIVPRRIPEHVSHRGEYLQIVYTTIYKYLQIPVGLNRYTNLRSCCAKFAAVTPDLYYELGKYGCVNGGHRGRGLG